MSAPGLTQKLIVVTFTLGDAVAGPNAGQPQTFTGTSSNTVKLSGLRCSAQVVFAGGATLGALALAVYGMTLSQMNQLSTLGMQVIITQKGTVTVEAGDVNGLSTVFTGTINNAFIDFSAMPAVCLRVEATAGLYSKVAPATPTSYAGTTSAATAIQTLAFKAGVAAGLGGYGFENQGVTAQISNPYLWGSYWDQMGQLAKAAHCHLYLDTARSTPTVVIWPIGASRGGQVPVISKDTGMVGYPSFVQSGVRVKTVFNPQVSYGTNVNVQSKLPQATGMFYVYRIDHDLDSTTPNGNWFSILDCYVLGYIPVT